MTEEKKDSPTSEKQEAPVKEEVKKETSSEDKKQVKVPAKFKDLIKQIEELSVMDLADLVKVLEDKFGVSAMPMAAAVPAAGGGEGEVAAEEKSEFDIEIQSAGGQKISVIKVVKEITGLGLKESKDMVDEAPKVVKQGVKKEEAEEIKKKLEEAGATVELK